MPLHQPSDDIGVAPVNDNQWEHSLSTEDIESCRARSGAVRVIACSEVPGEVEKMAGAPSEVGPRQIRELPMSDVQGGARGAKARPLWGFVTIVRTFPNIQTSAIPRPIAVTGALSP